MLKKIFNPYIDGKDMRH